MNHPQDAAHQQRQRCDAVDDVGDDHGRGFTPIGIGLDQLAFQHKSTETEHEAHVVHVGDTGVFSDVGSQSHSQLHGIRPENAATLTGLTATPTKIAFNKQKKRYKHCQIINSAVFITPAKEKHMRSRFN